MQKKISLLLLSLILFIGCAQEEHPQLGQEDVALMLHPTIAVGVDSVPTRSAITGATFGSNSVLSACFTQAGSFNSYYAGYDNIKASYVFSWSYLYEGATGSNTGLGVFSSKGAFDIYSFHPYTPGVNPSNLGTIPFTIGTTNATNYDYVVASAKNIDPALTPSPIAVPLVHKHIMTAIRVRIKNKYIGPVMLTKMNLTTSDNLICTSGTFSAIDGSVARSTFTNSLTITYNHDINTAVSDYYIIIPPIASSAADVNTFTITLYLNNGLELLSGKFTQNLNAYPVAGEYGLRKGYQYTFNVDIDNYVKFGGTPQVGVWEAGDIFDVEI